MTEPTSSTPSPLSPGRIGRPRKEYKPEYAEQARKLCLLMPQATDVELAAFFDISRNILARWRRENENFRDAIREGKTKADANVAASLYHRAVGYSHTAVKIFMVDETEEIRDPETGAVTNVITTKKERYVPYTEHYPPDTQAAFIWLKNRNPEGWRDRSEQNVNVRGEVVFKLEAAKPADELLPGPIVDVTPGEGPRVDMSPAAEAAEGDESEL